MQQHVVGGRWVARSSGETLDEDDAIALANATDFGLLAGIWTRASGQQNRVAERMHCGKVYINCSGAGAVSSCRSAASGRAAMGAKKGFMAREEFCNVKTVVQCHGK